MGKLNKTLSIIIILALISTSTIALNNTASATTSYGNPNQGDSQNNNYSLSFEQYSQASYADTPTVELVVGVGAASNSYSQLSHLIQVSGGEITNTVTMDANQAVIITLPTESASTFASKALTSKAASYVEPNHQYQVNSEPNDEYWSQQWGPKIIQANYAWNTTVGSNDILVSVIDTGVDYTHPDLQANYVALGYDWINNDTAPMDDFGHGTHCAGVIAAAFNNSLGIAGIAQVKIMAEKGLSATGFGSDSQLASAIVHSVNVGANILSCSWGSNESSTLLHEAIKYAVAHDVLVVFSAGNDGGDVSSYPAMFPEVISVGATTSIDELAYFSNYGDWVDVVAPGYRIYSTMPTFNVTMNDPAFFKNPLPLNYANMSGTSMACPHVSALAALVWSQHSTMSAELVRYILENTCDDLGEAGRDYYFGNGRINAKNAIEYTLADDLILSNWETPLTYLKTGQATSFNASLYNFAYNNQTDVEVQLLVNGTIANSESIPFIAPGERLNLSLPWTPTAAGVYNITLFVVPTVNDVESGNNFATGTFIVGDIPSESNWTLVGTDAQEGNGYDLKAVYTQVQSGTVYFKVEFYNDWENPLAEINAAIMIDADRNSRTGLPDNYYPSQNNSIGADYLAIVGWEGPEMWRWSTAQNFFDIAHPMNFNYLDAPENSSQFVVGLSLTDMQVVGSLDFVVADANSVWDWMPSPGYLPLVPQSSEHELAVTLCNAVSMAPGEVSVLNATVFNFGSTAETNVLLQIMVNGTVVSNNTIASLASGSAYSALYTFTPTIEGFYNITVYAKPVAGETATVNNAKSTVLPVHGKVAIISDYTELGEVEVLLNSINVPYTVYNYNYYYYNSTLGRYVTNYNMYTENLTLLSQFSTVIVSLQERNITEAEQTALNAYLQSGGNLLISGYEVTANNTRLADVVRGTLFNDEVAQGYLRVVNASHPIMNGPYGKFSANFTITGFQSGAGAIKADTSRNATTLAETYDGYARIIVTDSLPGKVVFWNGYGNFDWYYNASTSAIFRNMMLWFLDAYPVTSDDYDGAWHNSAFQINLSVDDYFGVNQTFYKINGGSIKCLSADGQPQITTDNANNTLEYWSTDASGHEETHHFLTQIKLDTTAPHADAGESKVVAVGSSVSLSGGGSSDNIGITSYSWDFGDGTHGSGASVTHTYSRAGDYGAKLTVSDAAGNTAVSTAFVFVTGGSTTATTSPTPTPTATPTPTPTANPNSITATVDSGSTVQLAIGGNITSTQITNANIHVNQTAATTTLSFNVTGEAGSTGFGNVTIPKSQVTVGTSPVIYIDGVRAEEQGYTEDANNYYIWYVTHFSTHELSIVFTGTPVTNAAADYTLWIALALVAVVVCVVAALLLFKRRKTYF